MLVFSRECKSGQLYLGNLFYFFPNWWLKFVLSGFIMLDFDLLCFARHSSWDTRPAISPLTFKKSREHLFQVWGAIRRLCRSKKIPSADLPLYGLPPPTLMNDFPNGRFVIIDSSSSSSKQQAAVSKTHPSCSCWCCTPQRFFEHPLLWKKT